MPLSLPSPQAILYADGQLGHVADARRPGEVAFLGCIAAFQARFPARSRDGSPPVRARAREGSFFRRVRDRRREEGLGTSRNFRSPGSPSIMHSFVVDVRFVTRDDLCFVVCCDRAAPPRPELKTTCTIFESLSTICGYYALTHMDLSDCAVLLTTLEELFGPIRPSG